MGVYGAEASRGTLQAGPELRVTPGTCSRGGVSRGADASESKGERERSVSQNAGVTKEGQGAKGGCL